MSLGENRLLWLGAAAFLALAALLVWILFFSEPFTLLVLFDDIGNLKRGDPVVWKTFTVGKVDEIRPLVEGRIGVTIRIKQDYLQGITRGSEFTLRQASLLGLIGDNAIEVSIPSIPGAPFSNGEKVRGIVPPSGFRSGQKWTLEYWRRMRDRSSRLLDELRSSPLREDVKEALDQLAGLAEKGARQARDGMDRFREEHQEELDRILEKLRRLGDEMRKRGDEPGAERIEKEIEHMSSGVGESPNP